MQTVKMQFMLATAAALLTAAAHDRALLVIEDMPQDKREELIREIEARGWRFYTPRLKSTNQRLLLALEPTDPIFGTRGLGLKGTVCDKISGLRFRIYGAACSLAHCQCDAVAVEVR